MRKLVFLSAFLTLSLTACGSSKPSAEGTPDSSAGSETTVAGTTAAPEATASETTTAGTTVAVAGSPETTAAAGMAAAGADPLQAIFAGLGVTEQKDIDCITKKSAELGAGTTAAADAGSTGVSPKLLQAVFACQPPQLVSMVGSQIATRIPTATPDQIDCAAKATLTVLAKQDNLDLSAMTGAAAVPADLQALLLGEMESCGFSEVDLRVAAGLS